MKKNIAKLMLVLIVGAVLLTGCRDTGDNNPPDTPKDTATQSVAPEEIKYKSVSVRDYEPCHEMKTPTFFESAEINGNTYQFHPEVSEEDKTHFIESQRILLDKLEEKRGEAVEGYTFRVFNIYASRSDSDLSTVYYGMDDAESWKHILATVQAIYGDTTTYGYVYAMADALSAELGWKADVKESSSSPSVFYETPELLTLTYPCFTQRYVTAGQKNAAVALSIDVFGKMAKPYSGEHEFIQKVKEYGADNGIEYPKIDFRFTSASEYCVLGIETDYLDILIDNTYEFDFYFSGTAYQYDSWESDLTTMYAKLGHVVSRLKTVREKLGGEPPERATIRLTHGGERFTPEEFSQYSYVTDENIPYCMLTHSVNTIVEIYTRYAIESVADAETYNGWYYNMLYLYLAHEETSAVYRDAMTYDEKKWAEYYTGGSIDTPEGMMKYYEVIIHKNSGETEPKKWVTDLDPYWEAVCFADYLVREYGEKSFIQLMLHPTRNMEYLGTQTYKVLFQWEEYILNECPKIYPAVADPDLIYLAHHPAEAVE